MQKLISLLLFIGIGLVLSPAPAAEGESPLVSMRALAAARDWKAIVEKYAEVDFAAWPSEQGAQAIEALQLRSRAYLGLKDQTHSIDDLRAALKIAPREAGLWLGLADCYEQLALDREQALAAFRQAHAITGKSHGWQSLSATLGIARILTDQVQPAAALETLQQRDDLAAMAPIWRIKFLRALGHAYAAHGEESESLRSFQQALEVEATSTAPGTAVVASVPPAKVSAVPRAAADASPLFAGTAKVEITPEPGWAFNVAGQPLSPREPLYARVLVLKNKQTSLAIVSLDLLIFASPKVIATAKEKWGVEHVILSATHTHAAPSPRGLFIQPPRQPDWTRLGRDPAAAIDWPALSADPWYAATEDKVIAAIGNAAQSMFPARLVSGKGTFASAYMAHNRRRVQAGRATAMWENPDRRPTAPIDPTLGVIRIDDMQGRPRAIAVQYACHPVATMTAGVVSRDFPGALVDHLEQKLGPDCLAMYLQGAQGDLDPYDLHNLRGENRFNIVQQAGISLANGALRIAAELKSTAVHAAASIQVRNSLLTIPYRTGDQTVNVGLLTAVINHDLALVAIPGEPFIQHQLDLSAQSPLAKTFILGLAYHGQGSPFVIYIPTEQAVQEGGYGATECSFVAADAGAKLVAEALARIREMTGAESKASQ